MSRSKRVEIRMSTNHEGVRNSSVGAHSCIRKAKGAVENQHCTDMAASDLRKGFETKSTVFLRGHPVQRPFTYLLLLCVFRGVLRSVFGGVALRLGLDRLHRSFASFLGDALLVSGSHPCALGRACLGSRCCVGCICRLRRTTTEKQRQGS